jgi:hypothetical protein
MLGKYGVSRLKAGRQGERSYELKLAVNDVAVPDGGR